MLCKIELPINNSLGKNETTFKSEWNMVKKGDSSYSGKYKHTTFYKNSVQTKPESISFLSEDMFGNSYEYEIPRAVIEKVPDILNVTRCEQTHCPNFEYNGYSDGKWLYETYLFVDDAKLPVKVITLVGNDLTPQIFD